ALDKKFWEFLIKFLKSYKCVPANYPSTLARRHGRLAITHVAYKMCTLIWHMLIKAGLSSIS
ncbi:MAG: hypothetical protein ACRD5J_20040, partial [Nitrososphaeraceae archaeon]